MFIQEFVLIKNTALSHGNLILNVRVPLIFLKFKLLEKTIFIWT
jgi:hypothetical protein